MLVHEVHVGLVAEEQLHNLGDRHYRLFDNVTIVIIVINMIITTKGKPPCVHGPWQDAEVCRRPYWLCELVPRDRSIDDDVMMDMMMAVIVTLITMMTVIIAMIMMMLGVCTRAPRPIY